jgi:hypothetical protein
MGKALRSGGEAETQVAVAFVDDDGSGQAQERWFRESEQPG